jgi:hypothetical protein
VACCLDLRYKSCCLLACSLHLSVCFAFCACAGRATVRPPAVLPCPQTLLLIRQRHRNTAAARRAARLESGSASAATPAAGPAAGPASSASASASAAGAAAAPEVHSRAWGQLTLPIFSNALEYIGRDPWYQDKASGGAKDKAKAGGGAGAGAGEPDEQEGNCKLQVRSC